MPGFDGGAAGSEGDPAERDERYRSQRDALVRLTSDEGAASEELEAAFLRIAEIDAQTLGVARVSVWLYNADRTVLECHALHEPDGGRIRPGVCLHLTDYPIYFRSLSEWTVIAADNAHGDARTAEFSASYLTPLGINSMMDASIHVAGSVVGVLCHEHVGPARVWTEDEKTFGVAVASIVALALEGAERRRNEAELREQRDLLHRAHQALHSHLHNSPLAVIEWDRDFRVIRWSDHAATLFGWTAADVLHRRPDEWRFVHDADRARVADCMHELMTGAPRNQCTNRNYSSTGDVIHCEWYNSALVDERGELVSILSLIQDVSERVRAETEQRAVEARLLQAQKLETVGRLAGGIAHDFNNLLTVINGTADLALDSHGPTSPLHADLQQIRQAGERAANLTRQLLAFSRKQILRADVLDVNLLIGNLQGMLKRLMGEHLELNVILDPAAGNVWADAGQMEQVIVNLAVNARDAMPGGGTLTIRTRSVMAPGEPGMPASIQPGRHVLLTVTDTGIGMDESTRLQIFDPFFTTKEPEKGTGLGLAMVHGIVMQSGGAIWVDSTPGAGSTFSVCLPITEAAAARIPAAETAARVRGRGTILIVEDEPALNRLAQRILAGAGYSVVCASNGNEALSLLQARAGSVDLMLTDVVMPGMSGRELASRVAAAFPRIRVLFTSGYTDDEILRHGVLDHAACYLGKPYTIQSLTRAVRELLDADTAAPPAVAATA